MDMEDLQTFLVVAEENSFIQAAERLFVSQPAITARIKRLESELDCRLFMRNNKQVKLTPQGQQFYMYAKRAYKTLQDGKRKALLSQEYRQHISLGAPGSAWDDTLMSFIDSYFNAHQRTALEAVCEHSVNIVSDLLNENLDIGVIYTKPHYYNIETIEYYHYQYILVIDARVTPPAEMFSPQNATQFPYVHMDWGLQFDEWFRTYYNFRSALTIENTFLLLDQLLRGGKCGFMHQALAEAYINDGRLKQLDFAHSNSIPEEVVSIAFLKHKREQLEPFIQAMINHRHSLAEGKQKSQCE